MANTCCLAKPFTALRDLLNRVAALEMTSGSNMDGLRDKFYPVGSIYMSIQSQNPATFIGGTWVRITDKFLLAAGENYAPGTTGGEAEHNLTEAELPYIEGTAGVRSYGTTASLFTAVNGAMSVSTSATTAGGVTPATTDPGSVRTLKMSFGGGASHNNMPPYQAVYMWRRTA